MATEKTKYEKNIENGLCGLCGKNVPDNGHKICRECLDKRRERNIKLKLTGICTCCKHRPARPGKAHCVVCAANRKGLKYRGNEEPKELWLRVSDDEYELPLVVADSARELAMKCNTTTNHIYSCICHSKDGKRKHSIYRKVPFAEI